jgi:flavodoxin
MNFAAEKRNLSDTRNTIEEEAPPLSSTKTILVAYFSHSGNTREIATQIHKILGGGIFKIQALKPYPRDYDAVVKQAKQELDSGYNPALKTRVKNIKSYSSVFIGYPIWWYTIPAPVKAFLLEYDFSGKTIAPFCTHGGSGLTRSVADISILCPRSTVLDGVGIWGREVKTAQNKVFEWVRKIKITK